MEVSLKIWYAQAVVDTVRRRPRWEEEAREAPALTFSSFISPSSWTISSRLLSCRADILCSSSSFLCLSKRKRSSEMKFWCIMLGKFWHLLDYRNTSVHICFCLQFALQRSIWQKFCFHWQILYQVTNVIMAISPTQPNAAIFPQIIRQISL